MSKTFTPIYENTVGSAVVKVYEDLTNIPDSLLLESGTLIASFEDKERDLYVSYITRGEVKICYKGDYYRYPQDFPNELTEMIRNGTVYDSEDVYMDFNNWFSGEQWSAPLYERGEFLFDDVIDIENMSPEQIADDIQIWAEEIWNANGENQLKPCPFCGNKAQLVVTSHSNSSYNTVRIECTVCPVQMGASEMLWSGAKDKLFFTSREDVIKAWNKRKKGEQNG